MQTCIIEHVLCEHALLNVQDEADNSNAPHVGLKAHRLIADHLRGHEFWRTMHHHQRFTLL